MTKSDDCEEVSIGALYDYEGMTSSKIQVFLRSLSSSFVGQPV